jgi:hypothetical protein
MASRQIIYADLILLGSPWSLDARVWAVRELKAAKPSSAAQMQSCSSGVSQKERATAGPSNGRERNFYPSTDS